MLLVKASKVSERLVSVRERGYIRRVQVLGCRADTNCVDLISVLIQVLVLRTLDLVCEATSLCHTKRSLGSSYYTPLCSGNSTALMRAKFVSLNLCLSEPEEDDLFTEGFCTDK